MAIEHLNDGNFDAYIAEGTVIVDFWAEWCGPCRMLGPVFEELSGETEGVKFAKVDISANEAIAQKFRVMSIPTIILFKDGEETGRMMGAVPKEHLKQWLEDKL
jgi:thioredoxin 1